MKKKDTKRRRTHAPAKDKATKQSLYALAAELGKLRSTIYDWKSRGAPVEKGAEEVLAWAFENVKKGTESDDIKEAKLGVLHETKRRLKLANDEKSGLLIEFSTVRTCIGAITGHFFSQVDRMQTEYPMRLRGLGASEIEAVIKADCRDIKSALRSQLEAFESGNEPKIEHTDATGAMARAAELAERYADAVNRWREAALAGNRELSSKIWHGEVTPLEDAKRDEGKPLPPITEALPAPAPVTP